MGEEYEADTMTVYLDHDEHAIVLDTPFGKLLLDPDAALALMQRVTVCFAALAGVDDPEAMVLALGGLKSASEVDDLMRAQGIIA